MSRALQVATMAGASELAVLHCVSAYPTPPDAENLRAIATLAESTGVPTGLSDHGSGLLSAVAAVALGACIYERHLVLDADDDAIDRAVSSTPTELKAIVSALGADPRRPRRRHQALSAGREAERRTEPPWALRGANARGRTAAHRLRHRGPASRIGPRAGQARNARGIRTHTADGDRRGLRARGHSRRSARMNVLMTAASRRVALGAGVSGRAAALRRPSGRDRRGSLVTGGPRRRSRLSRAVFRRLAVHP